MSKGVKEGLRFLIDTLGQLITGLPQMFGIDEWYIFYIAIFLIGIISKQIFKRK